MEECIFCKIADGEISTEKIYENDNFFVIPDANPVVRGHSLIISKKHFKNIMDLPGSLGDEFMDAVKKASLKLMGELKCEGFNLVQNNFKVAGQLVNHFHFHIIPRKDGDEVKILH